MKQEIKLIVESTDLPTYEPGFTDQGYLSLNTHTKIVVPNRNVEFLDHLIAAATALAASIRKTQEPVDLDEALATRNRLALLIHEKTPGSAWGDTWDTADAILANFDLAPRVKTQQPTTQPAELQHPGTWLPGDQVIDGDGDLCTRFGDGKWRFGRRANVAWPDDSSVDLFLLENPNSRILSLAPRQNAQASA